MYMYVRVYIDTQGWFFMQIWLTVNFISKSLEESDKNLGNIIWFLQVFIALFISCIYTFEKV